MFNRDNTMTPNQIAIEGMKKEIRKWQAKQKLGNVVDQHGVQLSTRIRATKQFIKCLSA